VCDSCQKSVSKATNTNIKFILMGFAGFALAFIPIYLLGFISRELGLSGIGATLITLIGLACLVAFPILLAKPFFKKRDPELIAIRKRYEQVQCRTMMAASWEADVVLEFPSSQFANAFAQSNGGTVEEKAGGTFVLA
jgi:hypothetical protein